MKRMLVVVAAGALALAPALARAQEAQDKPTVRLEQGQVAPFEGALVNPARFEAYLKQQALLEQCRVDKTVAELKQQGCEGDLGACRSSTSTLSPSTAFWLGAGAGVVAAGLVVVGIFAAAKQLR